MEILDKQIEFSMQDVRTTSDLEKIHCKFDENESTLSSKRYFSKESLLIPWNIFTNNQKPVKERGLIDSIRSEENC